MRVGLDGATSALYTSGNFDLHTRLKVENGSFTLKDLQGRFYGYVLNLPNPNEPIGSLEVQFIRETSKAGLTSSLAPTVTVSSFNKLNDNTTYSPLLQIGRLVTLEVALTAVNGARPADGSSLWYEIFKGYITEVNWPEWDSHNAAIRCNGLAGRFQIQKSEVEYKYLAGTSIETVAQQILSNNGFSSVTAAFPVSTGKVIPLDYEPGLQKSVWEQLWSLAQSMGWIVYYKYTGVSSIALTFFEPARTKSSSDMTIDAHDYRGLALDEEEIRNVGYLRFFDQSSNLQMIGPFEDTASITKYGGSLGIRRPFWIALDEESPIRSTSEANDMLNAALLDVADPDMLAEVLTFPLVFAESGTDLYTFLAMDRLFDSNQTLAPFSITIDIKADQEPVSVVAVRGIPTAGSKTWKGLTEGGPLKLVTAHGPGNVPGTIIGRAEIVPELRLNQITGALTLRVAKGSAISGTIGFVYFHSTTLAGQQAAQYGNGTPYFYTAGEDTHDITLPTLSSGQTAYVRVWGMGPQSPTAPNSVGTPGVRYDLNVTNFAGAPSITSYVTPHQRFPMMFDAHVTINDPNNLGGKLEIWTQNSIFAGSQPNLNGIRWTADATTNVFQAVDLNSTVIALPATGLADGQMVRLGKDPGDNIPSQTPILTDLFMRDVNIGVGTFKLALTAGGAAIDITGTGLKGRMDAAPQDTIIIPSTPFTAGPADSRFLGMLIASDVTAIDIQFRFTNNSNITSGRVRVAVPPMIIAVNGFGQFNGTAQVTPLDPSGGSSATVVSRPNNSSPQVNAGDNIGFTGPPYTSVNGQKFGYQSLDISAYAGQVVSASAEILIEDPAGQYPARVQLRVRFYGAGGYGGGNLLATFTGDQYTLDWAEVASQEIGNPSAWATPSVRQPRLPLNNMTIPVGATSCWIDAVGTWITGYVVILPTLVTGMQSPTGYNSIPSNQTVNISANQIAGLVNTYLMEQLAIAGTLTGIATPQNAVVTASIMNAPAVLMMMDTVLQVIRNSTLDRINVLLSDSEHNALQIQSILRSAIADAESIGLATTFANEWLEAAKLMIGLPGNFVSAVDQYDATALLKIYDALTRRFGNVVSVDGGGQVLAIGPATVNDGLSPRPIVKGHVAGTCEGGSVSGSSWTNGTAVNFPVVFQGVPAIILSVSGGVAMEWRRAKWTGNFDTVLPVRIERVALNPSAGGFTPVCRLMQPLSTFTARDDNFGGSPLTTLGANEQLTLGNPPAYDNHYQIRINADLSCQNGGPLGIILGQASISFNIDTDDGGGYVTRISATVSIDCTNGSPQSYSGLLVYHMWVAGLGSGDKVRIIITGTLVQGGSGSASITPVDVLYTTATGTPIYASLTPDQASDGADRIEYKAFSVI